MVGWSEENKESRYERHPSMLASEAWSCLVVEVVGTSVKDDRGLYTQAFPLVLTEPGIVMLENPERQ